MLPIKKRQRLVVLMSFVVVLAIGIDQITRHLSAKEPSPQQGHIEALRDTEVVSDRSSEEMAREILMLQQQLGGSIVPAAEPQRWLRSGDPLGKALITDREVIRSRHTHSPSAADLPSHQLKKIETLREAAFDLDRTAHELERLDLYEQADALRSVASRLRRDARGFKQQSARSVIEGSMLLTPTPADAVPTSE